MTTFNWSITKMDVRSDQVHNNVVITVWFKITGIDGQYTYEYKNGVGLDEPIEPFVPFNELTEQQVLQWTKDKLTPEYCQLLEQGVQNKIDNMKYATVQQVAPPW